MLSIITSLYSPPGWMTKQGFLRGRDLAPGMYRECAKYMASWAYFLRHNEGLPLDYIALHNEGESLYRWPSDGSGPCWQTDRDYNMFWPTEQVVEFLSFMRDILNKNDLERVGLTPGETSTWTRFSDWGYARAIADSEKALGNLSLITSHGFIRYVKNKWFGDHRSAGTDLLRSRKPELHAWVTSSGWGDSDVFFVKDIRDSIYAAKVNGYIPWVIIKRPILWRGGDPNARTALSVGEDGSLTVDHGYHYYKQISRAGQPGMQVVHTVSRDLEIEFAAFSGDQDSLVITNIADEEKDLHIALHGTDTEAFEGYVTSPKHKYEYIGLFKVDKNRRTGVNGNKNEDVVLVSVPAKSVTTFFAAKGPD
jgi:O-glycosyl hydrolase